MKTVLFACVHNAGRSQMAAALFNQMADPSVGRAVSAGTEPADDIHPVVLEVMREIGVDLSGARPRKLSEELARQAQVHVTMGCGDACPYVPGARVEDWAIDDPKGRPLAEARQIRDDIAERVADLIARERLGRG